MDFPAVKGETPGKQRFLRVFAWIVITVGAAVMLLATYQFPTARVDARLLVLSLIMILFSSRLTIQVPRAKVHFSFSDTFVFLTLLLYGAETAVLLSAAEALCSSLRFGKKEITIKLRTILYNAASTACATLLTVATLKLCFGSIEQLASNGYTSIFFTALSVMALTQYIASTLLIAIYTSCKANQSIWYTWRKHYLWTSVTYFAGAAAAGGLVNLADGLSLSAVVVATVVIGIVYFTCDRYIEDVKTSAAQAEQAERARAEQAERHVSELSHYIAELERTGKELRDSKEHFRHAAFHDRLTGLPNRALLNERLRSALERSGHQDGYHFALLFLDLDRFKNINDSLGHAAGDQLLVTLARCLENCVRTTDTVARLGGDEFALLVEGIRGESDAVRMAQQVQKELESPFMLGGHEVFASTSIGIALSAVGYEHPEDVLRDADTAMYRAKESGKACYAVFDTSMHARAMNLLRLENDMRRALERKEFRIHYQPMVRLEAGDIAGFEALVRWEHPQRGFISPAEFISVAEDTRLIIPLGLWVLRESCKQMVQWQSQFNKRLTLSVNLSGKQFTQHDLVEQIESILNETRFDPCLLKLEITESVVMENAEVAIAMLNRLKALGVQLSIDDFGTGYASLSYLHRFPFDTLKIDRSFVSQLGLSDDNTEIVRTIKTLASNMRMEVVAEGVETFMQLRQLDKLKCEYGQGYLFSEPVDRVAAEILIASKPSWYGSEVSAITESILPHDNVSHVAVA